MKKNKRTIRAITLLALICNWLSVFMFVKTRTIPLFWIVLFMGTSVRIIAFLYVNSMFINIVERRTGKEPTEENKIKRYKLFIKGSIAWLCSIVMIVCIAGINDQFNGGIPFTKYMSIALCAVPIISFLNEQNEWVMQFLRGIFCKSV